MYMYYGTFSAMAGGLKSTIVVVYVHIVIVTVFPHFSFIYMLGLFCLRNAASP